jgi:hypothetical protein
MTTYEIPSAVYLLFINTLIITPQILLILEVFTEVVTKY